MLHRHSIIFAIAATFVIASCALAQKLPREQWGAPAVSVTHEAGKWVIAGKRNKVTMNDTDFALSVVAEGAQWSMVPSSAKDMLVKSQGNEFPLRLADAKKISIVPYDTGFRTGIKITLGNWQQGRRALDLGLILTLGFEGKDEELVFDVTANEHEALLRQLDWPAALDATEIDYTLLSNGRGTLLPRNWPKEYFPIRTMTPEGKIAATDHSMLQSHVIESWSMSWWGFQKGKSAMMVIVETPDDAAYQFSHPAGGPTVIGPRWRAQLGHFNYLRSARMITITGGNYVDMAKRYRMY